MTHEPIPPTKFPRTKREEFSGPAPRFDCLEALRPHIGNALWACAIAQLRHNNCTICAKKYLACEFGVEGFPAEVFYDHVHGQGSLRAQFPEDEKQHMRYAYEEGKEIGLFLKSTGLPAEEIILSMDEARDYPEDFRAGMEDGSGLRARDINERN